jgi:hypothetical protein
MSDCHGVTTIVVLIGTYSVCGVEVRSLGLYPAISPVLCQVDQESTQAWSLQHAEAARKSHYLGR